MKLQYIIAAALLSFVTGLVAHAPAASLYGWLASEAAPVRLHGISGSVLSGAAIQLMRGNQIIARDVRWRLAPPGLLLGRAEYALAAASPPLLLDGIAGIGLGGSMRLRDLRASGGLRELAASVGQPFVPVDGQLGIELQLLTLVDRWPREAQGRVQIIGLSWTLGRQPTPLGDYQALVETEDGSIVAAVSTLKGAVDVDGRAALSPDGRYEVNLQLRAAADAPPMVGNLLQSLGPPDARGYHRLQREGRLARPVAEEDVEPVIEEPTFGGQS